MKGFFLKYGLPLLIVSVVITQFYQVYFHNLSRWKGGGFGMYSDWQPENRQVWIVINDSAFIINNPKKHPRNLVVMAHHLKFFPSQNKVELFGKAFQHFLRGSTLRVQVWEPFLNPAENCVSRKLLIEQSFDASF